MDQDLISRKNSTPKKNLRFNFKKIKIPKASHAISSGVGGDSRSHHFRPWQGCRISVRFPERHRERYECERERKRCGQTNPKRKKEMRAANQRRQPCKGTGAGIVAVTGDVGFSLGKTTRFQLISERDAE